MSIRLYNGREMSENTFVNDYPKGGVNHLEMSGYSQTEHPSIYIVINEKLYHRVIRLLNFVLIETNSYTVFTRSMKII